MSASCCCKRPQIAGEGESEHCTACGCWTERACNLANERKRREQMGRHHVFAEHTSRYDLRCIRCGVRARDPEAKEPCTERSA